MSERTRKWKKAVLWTVSSVAALFLLMMVTLQLVLSPDICTSLVQKYASQLVDGKLSLGEASVSVFSHFPAVTLNIDDFTVTYPSRFGSDSAGRAVVRNRLELAGSDRFGVMDTLASFRKLSVSLNVLSLLAGDIRVKNLEFTRPRAFIHVYPDSTSNLDVIHLPKIGESSDDDTSSFVVHNLVVKKLFIGSRSSIVFTDARRDMYALLLLQGMNFRGRMSALDPLKNWFSFGVDSLMVTGNYNSDTLLFALDRLALENRDSRLSFDAAATAFAATKKLGRVRLPLNTAGALRIGDIEKGRFRATLSDLSVDLSSIHADAFLEATVADTIGLKGWAEIKDLDVQNVLNALSEKLIPDLAFIQTDARVDVRTDVDGWYATGMKGLPAMTLALDIPQCHTCIAGISGAAQLGLQARAVARQAGEVDVDVERFSVQAPGIQCNLKGGLYDVLGSDPEVCVDLSAGASVPQIVDRFGDVLGISGSGEVSASAKGRFNFSNLSIYNLDGVRLDSRLNVTGLNLSALDDSLRLHCNNLAVTLGRKEGKRSGKTLFAANAVADSLLYIYKGKMNAHGRGLDVSFTASPKIIEVSDSLAYSPLRVAVNMERCFVKGADSVSLKIRRTKNVANIRPSRKGRVVPVVKLSSSNERIRLNMGPHRLSLRGLAFDASARLEDRDYRFSADSVSFINFFRKWNFHGGLGLDSLKINTPALPIKTVVTDFKGSFDNDKLSLDTLRITSGASDLEASGKITRLRSALLGTGTPKFRADIYSDTLAFDELMGAFARGQVNMKGDLTEVAAMSDEKYDSFVEERRKENAAEQQAPRLVVIPPGMDAELNVHGRKMRFSTLDIHSFDASLLMKRQCLQIKDITARSNAGDVRLEAFYSTSDRNTLTTGFDVSFADISASQIISLIPSVDTLMPLLKTFDGKLSCGVAATAVLDTNMNIIVPSATGVMRVAGRNLHFNNDKQVEKLMRRLMFRKPKEARVDSMMVEGVLRDGQLEIFPFILKMDSWTVSIAGIQGVDKKFSYHASLIKSPILIKLGATLYGDDFDHINFKLGKPRFKKENAIPSFSAAIDTTRVNLVTGIRHVFDRGVEAALEENDRRVEMKQDRERQNYLQSASLEKLEELSASEKAAADSLSVCTP